MIVATPIKKTAKPIQKGKKLGEVKPLKVKVLKSYMNLRTF